MIPHTRSAVAALSLAVALGACTATGEPVAGGAAETAAVGAANTGEAAPRMGSASAALQTGVSTGAITRAPQRPAPVPPPAAAGPSIAAAHAAPPTPQAPLIPEPEPAAAPASAPSPAAPARPPSPAAAAEPVGLGAAAIAGGHRLFNAFSCGACHVLADAGGAGHVGPSLDGNAALTRDYVIGIVTNGRGAMPGFGGQLTDEEIALLASYIIEARR